MGVNDYGSPSDPLSSPSLSAWAASVAAALAGGGSGNSGVLTWDGLTYQPTSMHESTVPREFRGPADPSTVTGVVLHTYDVWVEMSAPGNATVPSQVTGLQATPGDTQVSLTWSAPYDGGSAITDYLVEKREGTGSWSTYSEGVSTNTYATVTGLSNGTQYGFRVSAINAIGTGSASTEQTATPAAGASYRSLLVSYGPIVLLNDADTVSDTFPTDAMGNATIGKGGYSYLNEPHGGQTGLGDTGHSSEYDSNNFEGFTLGQPTALNSQAFSIVALVYVTSLASERAVACRDDAGPNDWALRDFQFKIDTNGNLNFTHIGGAQVNVKEIKGGTLTANATHLVALTSDGSQAWVYLDGTQVATDTHSARSYVNIPWSVATLLNASSGSDRRYMHGRMDGVALFNKKLTGPEVDALATAAGV